jgi:hypothetical protein
MTQEAYKAIKKNIDRIKIINVTYDDQFYINIFNRSHYMGPYADYVTLQEECLLPNEMFIFGYYYNPTPTKHISIFVSNKSRIINVYENKAGALGKILNQYSTNIFIDEDFPTRDIVKICDTHLKTNDEPTYFHKLNIKIMNHVTKLYKDGDEEQSKKQKT